MTTVFILLILFQIKHWICDFPLQNKYMLGKFKESGWVTPLLAHVGVHGAGTYIITVMFVSPLTAIGLALLDISIHFMMDRVKASPNMLGRFKPDNKYFWWSLGIDQGVHHLTHYAIIAFVIL